MPGIEIDEFRERQRRAAEAAAGLGLRALVAFSRGGGSHDRVADVLWLTGLSTSQPFVPDFADHWRGAGHMAVIVPVDGPVTAVVESEEQRPFATADEVLVAGDLVAAAADALGRIAPGRIGVLGSDVVPHAWWRALEALLGPSGTLEPADELGMRLRRVKSPAELELMRAAGRLASRAMAAALDAAVPGATEAAAAAALHRCVVEGGGAIYDVVVSSGPASGTLGPSGGATGTARWTTRRLQAGELFRIDAYGSLAGYLFDLARTIVVGGEPSDEQQALIDAMRASVQAGIAALRPGAPLADVARACEDTLAASEHARRHGVPPNLMDGYWGHGLGLGFDPPWIGRDSEEIVQAGWCLAIERRAAVPGLGGAQYEDDLLVGPAGAEVLTETVGQAARS